MKYDHPALERHILNRFIHGKPTIILIKDDLPQVVYRKDIYTTDTFSDVKKKVAPQASIHFHLIMIIMILFILVLCNNNIPLLLSA